MSTAYEKIQVAKTRCSSSLAIWDKHSKISFHETGPRGLTCGAGGAEEQSRRYSHGGQQAGMAQRGKNHQPIGPAPHSQGACVPENTQDNVHNITSVGGNI